MGMDAALHINPYYGKTSETGLLRHFQAVLGEGPAMIYNVPGRTGQDIPDSVVEELAGHDNFLGVKECTGIERIRVRLLRLGREHSQSRGFSFTTFGLPASKRGSWSGALNSASLTAREMTGCSRGCGVCREMLACKLRSVCTDSRRLTNFLWAV